MWRDTCKRLVNLERLENEFVEYYGENHREEIKNKLKNTTFGFAITDLDGFLNTYFSFYTFSWLNKDFYLIQTAHTPYICATILKNKD